MALEEPTRNGYHRLDHVQEPEDPSGQARSHAWVSARELAQCFKHSPWKAQNLWSALKVLQNPARIYRHIRPGEEESGWCYSRRLERVVDSGGNPVPARRNTVFTVYINQDCSVFEWGQEEADPSDPDSPKGAKEALGEERGRFGMLVWENA